MRRRIITILLGTLIIFVWNAVSWTVLPFHSNSLNNIPKSAIDADKLQKVLPSDGVYHYPGLPDGNEVKDLADLEKKLNTGPRITLMVFKKGATNLFDPKTLGLNLLFNFLTVVITFFIVYNNKNKTLKNIVVTTSLIGLTIGLVSDLPQMNWYLFPLEYTLVNVFDHIIALVLIGFLFGLYTFKKEY